ncbi:MAG: hypothetical protein WCD70_07730 [Alphaproteobacteria bacterium]
MSDSEDRHYPRTYKILGLIRWVVTILAILIGCAFAGSILYSSDAQILPPNVTPTRQDPVFYIVVIICSILVFYIHWRRVVLFENAIAIRGFWKEKKYLVSEIKGIINFTDIVIKNRNKKIKIPPDIHPDALYRQWFNALPQIDHKGMFLANNLSQKLKEGDGTVGIGMDQADLLRLELGVDKQKARLILFLSIAVIIIVGIFTGISFSKIGLIGLLVLAKAEAYLGVALCLFLVLAVRWVKKKINERK